ncbi:MAG: hypothetical protein ABIZ91_07040 [Gemmatimonadaceae bacterium]
MIRRVEQKLGGTTVRSDVVRDVVARTLGALPNAAPDAPSVLLTVIVTAASLPDLASRLRRAAEPQGIVIDGLCSATEGRHTVVTLRTGSVHLEALRRAVEGVGGRMVQRGGAV